MKPFLFTLALLSVALAATGCAKKNPEPVVRERAHAYTQLLVDEKYDDALAYFDPDIVAKQGHDTVVGWFKFAIGVGKGLNQLAGRKSAGFEIRNAYFDTTGTNASIHVVFLSTDARGGDRKEFPTDQMWVLKNNTWYVIK